MLALIGGGFAALAYLLGSVPFSFLVARLHGVDLRTVGSGNIGAANVGRACGWRAFALAVALDMLKGFVPTALALYTLALPPLAVVLVGAAALLGHTYPVFLRFKGGKAVATGGGVLLAIFPPAMLLGVAAWGGLFALTRISALGSLAAALTALLVTLGYLLLGWLDPVYAGFICLTVAAVVYLHRGNIQRLRAGTENRFEKSS